MFSLPLPVKIELCVPRLNFRRSFDRLAAIVREAKREVTVLFRLVRPTHAASIGLPA